MARISKPPEERRQELVEAANALFLTQGYEQTTVGDIVKKVRVAQGLFYYYFRSKQDIFLAVIDQFLEARIGGLAVFLRDTQTSPLRRVRNLLQLLPSLLHETEVLFPRNGTGLAAEMHAIMYNHLSEQIEPTVIKLLQECAKQGFLSAVIPERLARFIISGFIGVESMPDRPKADEMMELIVFTVGRLLGVPRQELDAGE